MRNENRTRLLIFITISVLQIRPFSTDKKTVWSQFIQYIKKVLFATIILNKQFAVYTYSSFLAWVGLQLV